MKHPIASKTIWGTAIAALGLIAQILIENDQLVIPTLGERWGAKVLMGAGLVLAVIGRFKASGPLSLYGGAKPMSRRKIRAILPYAVLIGGGIWLPACVGPRASANGSGVRAKGLANISRQDDVSWESSLQGLGPTNVVADRDGLNQQSYSLHRTLTLAFDEVVVTLTDPLDGSLRGLRLTFPDGTLIELDELVSQPSITNASLNEQVIATLQANAEITEAQAAVARAAIEAGATLGEALISAGVPLLSP